VQDLGALHQMQASWHQANNFVIYTFRCRRMSTLAALKASSTSQNPTTRLAHFMPIVPRIVPIIVAASSGIEKRHIGAKSTVIFPDRLTQLLTC